MPKKETLFRHAQGCTANIFAISFVFIAYIGALFAITAEPLWLNIVGTLLLAESMIISAYLIHEFAHGNIFRRAKMNKRMAQAMQWINGSIYFPFDYLRKIHVQHHIRHADVVRFNFPAWIQQRPPLTRNLIIASEWLYIPTIEFIMRGNSFANFWRNNPQLRTQLLSIGLLRCSLFLLLISVAPPALLFYLIGYIIFIQVLRLMDAHQHTYEVYYVGKDGSLPEVPEFDTEYEEAHTYSNLISTRFPRLNLLVLNFTYHNAHHADSSVPWFKLPEFHKQLYGEQEQVLQFADLLKNFHHYRIKRIFTNQAEQFNRETWRDKFVGVVGVSFLY